MDQREVTSPPSVEDDNALYFKDIDKGFNSIDRLNDDVFRYNGQDVLVQSTWELPIIIQYPNSKIKFEVSSNEGDIQFGIMFVAALEEDQPDEDMVTEVIDDMGIVETHIKPYTGEFTPRCEGVVFFVWDNSHDWWSNKNISYVIELYQPTFTAIDTERQHLSLNLLPDVISTYTEECIKAADMADHSEALMLKIPLIEKKIEQLQKQLDLHKTELASITIRAEASTKIIETLDSRVLGLCIRSLNKEVLKHVLEYLYPSSSDDLGVLTVCKYWKGIFAEICDFRRSNPAGAAHDTDSTALSNSVITDSITNHTTYDGSESVKPVDTNNTPKPRKSKHKPALPLTEEYFKPRIENVDGKSPQFAARLKLREEERKLEEQQREWKEKKLLNGAKSPLAKIVDLCENDDRHAEGSRMGDDESASTGVDGMSALEAIGDPENCPGMQGFDRKSDVSVTEGNMMINLRKGNTKKQLAAWIDIIQHEIQKKEQYDRDRKNASHKLNAWVFEYEQKLKSENKSLPPKKELKQIMIENANDLYTKYLDATTKLKITTEYIESALAAGGLTKADFDHLAQKHALGKQQKLKM